MKRIKRGLLYIIPITITFLVLIYFQRVYFSKLELLEYLIYGLYLVAIMLVIFKSAKKKVLISLCSCAACNASYNIKEREL